MFSIFSLWFRDYHQLYHYSQPFSIISYGVLLQGLQNITGISHQTHHQLFISMPSSSQYFWGNLSITNQLPSIMKIGERVSLLDFCRLENSFMILYLINLTRGGLETIFPYFINWMIYWLAGESPEVTLRSNEPVDRCTKLAYAYFYLIIAHWVPLPEPGPPKTNITIGLLLDSVGLLNMMD